MSDHSILSPSAAHRWSLCEGSLAACKNIPNPTTVSSAKGTVQHTMSQLCLERGGDAYSFLGNTLETDGFVFVVDEEMCRHVQAYVDGIRRRVGRRAVEFRVDLSPVLGIPNQGGTADAIVLNRSEKRIEVHDAKFGYHQVNAQDNKQGLLYIAGALHHFDIYDEWASAQFTIHQPRIDHYDEAVYTVDQVREFIEDIKPRAWRAHEMYEGRMDPVLTPGPVQCQWCPARGGCAARNRAVIDSFATLNYEMPALDDAEVGAALARVEEIEGWCKDVKSEAHNRALAGRKIPGWKLIQGRKGKRYWKDPEKAEGVLSLALTDDAMYEPRKLMSPAVIEKALKKDFESVRPLVGQEDGAMQLVPESAKGDEVLIGSAADFEPLPTE